MDKSVECFERILAKAINEVPDQEIWPGYYKRRYKEFLNYYAVFPKMKFDSVLEIGCGMGYQSAFLSCVSTKVIASDIASEDNEKHSRGLEITREFISRLNLKNVEIISAHAELLPFGDGQFDFIFCSYSFQYINNKQRALSEIKRVLKPGGFFFCIVPTFSDRLEAAFTYYCELIKKIPNVISSSGKRMTSTVSSNSTNKVIDKGRGNKLLPPPDDGTKSFFSELFQRRKGRWDKVFAYKGFTSETIKFTADTKLQRTKIIRHWKRLRSSGIIYLLRKI